MPEIEKDIKLLVVKNFTHIININKEFAFVKENNILDTFSQNCYENYQVKQLFFVNGFMNWLENLLEDMKKHL